MSNDLKDIVLEEDAFEPEPSVADRPDLVEIDNAFDTITIPDSLVQLAKTNDLELGWEELSILLETLLQEQFTVMKDKVQDEETRKMIESLSNKIIHHINDHKNCPFTIQRLCELIIEPKKYYKMYIKYLRAVDKVLCVTSYWQDFVTSNDQEKAATFGIELEPHSFEQAE